MTERDARVRLSERFPTAREISVTKREAVDTTPACFVVAVHTADGFDYVAGQDLGRCVKAMTKRRCHRKSNRGAK